MTEEQIKEVMQLADELADACAGCDSSHFALSHRKELKSYLRTIGEPENTFPLNPNGASKWAHLQKHDGAEAIGVVFRTESGSVGSLVDGRVVWADWLAHPTGSKPESVNAELPDALKSAKNGLEWYQDAHPESASECDDEAMQEIDAAIARAESAIETPAKVSPASTPPLPHHVFRELVNDLRDLAKRFHGHESLRDRISGRLAQDVPVVGPCQGHAVQQEADEAGGA